MCQLLRSSNWDDIVTTRYCLLRLEVRRILSCLSLWWFATRVSCNFINWLSTSSPSLLHNCLGNLNFCFSLLIFDFLLHFCKYFFLFESFLLLCLFCWLDRFRCYIRYKHINLIINIDNFLFSLFCIFLFFNVRFHFFNVFG